LHAADAAQPLSAWDEVERHWPPSAVPSAVPRAAAAAEPALAATRCAPAPPSGLSTNFLERSVAAPSRSHGSPAAELRTFYD